MFGFNRKIFFASVFLIALFSLFYYSNSWAFTDVQNGGIGIGFSVPSICGNGVREGTEECDDGNLVEGDGCSAVCDNGGDPPTDRILPVIENVVKTPGNTSAKISWKATDNSGIIASQYFFYGIGNYAQAGTVVNLDNNRYEVNLAGLTTNVTYFFKIEASDPYSNKRTYTDEFDTVLVDTRAPNILNRHSTPSTTFCSVTWDTDELANGEINYGIFDSYGFNVSHASFLINHLLTLNNLIPNTLYHYRILSTDNAGNTTSTSDYTFTTLLDNISPDPPTDFVITVLSDSFKLDWNNPAKSGINADFAGVKLLRKIGGPAVSSTDGTLLYDGSNNTFTDNGVVKNIRYYYTLFSYDTSGNFSSGVSVDGIIVGTEICNNSLDDDNDTLVDCLDIQDCASQSYCLTPENCTDGIDNDGDLLVDCADTVDCASSCNPHFVEICNDNIDNDADTFIDCLDSDCRGTVYCPGTEICNNNLDDDGDTLVDCKDSDCDGYEKCGRGDSYACNDGLDNDGDALIDFPNDPGCSAFDDLDEYNPQIITIPDFQRITINDVIFSAGNGKIILSPYDQTITSLAGSGLQLKISASSLAFVNPIVSLKLAGASYLFNYNEQEKIYFLNLGFPSVGLHEAFIEVNYGTNGFDALAFKFKALGFGLIKDSENTLVADAEILLYESNGTVFSASVYAQSNPYFTNVNGGYGFVVPNGEYYLTIKKEGFNERVTPVFEVKNNVVNKDINLIKKIEEILVADPGETIKNLVAKFGEITLLTGQKIVDIKNNPEVKNAATPISIMAVAFTTLPFLSFAELLPFLRLLFLQPLFLLGRKKREKWGQIYNALNKLPVDLAIVRLVDAETGKILQSKVTDRNGRYAFVVEPGKYKLVVEKSGFVFPSSLLAGIKSDGRRVDIYHNEIIEVTEKDSIITVNVPLDVVGSSQKKPVRLIWQKVARVLQSTMAVAGFVLTAISFYISPVWYIGALLIVHIFLSLVFSRLAKPVKLKGWGIVYDARNKKPIGRTVARLFNADLNKLVASQITDRKGRYYFLAGDNKYFVTFEHPEYNSLKTETVDLSNKEADTVAVDVKLSKIDPEKVEIAGKKPENIIINDEKDKPDEKIEIKNKKEDIFG